MSQYSKFYLGTGAAPIEHISVGGGTVDPDGTGTITITNGANITWTAGVSTMQADVTGTTDHAVQVGNATGSLTSLGLGLNNQFLRGNTGADPSWNAVDLTTDVTGILPVGSGGTGVSSVTAHNLLVGDGTNALNEITTGTNGQFLLGVTGADAVFATPTNGNNISWTLGAGTTRADVTGTTQYTVQVGNATGSLTSLATGTATQVLQSGGAAANPAWSTATYPATTTQGDVIYSSADNTIVGLAKNATATRYIANTGASNNPAWDQVNLANGVTGTLPVTNGGLGVADPTDHAVLVGSGAAAVTPITVGNTGELLVGSTGADPAFGTSANGNFTFTTATAATDRTLAITNTDNTGANYSAAHLHIQTNSASTGDPYVRFDVDGGQDYSLGIDNSASDALLITDDTNPSTGNTLWKMTAAGEVTIPLQPAFFAYLSATASNVTGDNTAYTLAFNSEAYDQGGDYDTGTYTFTAPVTAKYFFSLCVNWEQIAAAHTLGLIVIQTSNKSLYKFIGPSNIMSTDGSVRASFSVESATEMDAADTCYCQTTVFNGAKAVDIKSSGAADPRSWFSGYQTC